MSLNSRDNQADEKDTIPQAKKTIEQGTKIKKAKDEKDRKERKRRGYQGQLDRWEKPDDSLLISKANIIQALEGHKKE